MLILLGSSNRLPRLVSGHGEKHATCRGRACTVGRVSPCRTGGCGKQAIGRPSTRSGNLYVQMNTQGEFLRSSILTDRYANTCQCFAEVLRVAELDSCASQSTCRLRERSDVVDINGLIRLNLAGA